MRARRGRGDASSQLELPLAEPRTFPVRGGAPGVAPPAPATHVGAVTPARRVVVEPNGPRLEAALRGSVHDPGVELVTLPVLEARLAQALLPARRVASRALSRVVLRQVMASSPAARAAASSSGLSAVDLVAAADSALASLLAAGVDAGASIAAAASSNPAIRARAALLSELLDAHARALDRLGLIDPRSVPARLAAALCEARGVAEAQSLAREVEIRDAIGLSPARLAWIERLHAALSRVGGRVVVVAPTAHDALLVTCGLDDPRERIAARIEERFVAAEDPPDLVHVAPGASGDGPLRAVAARLFAVPATSDAAPLDAGDRLHLVTAAGVAVEADVAAAEVARALARGVAPERIVVALPTLDETVVRALRRSMAAVGAPIYEPRGAPPASSLPVATLLAVLRALDSGVRKPLVVDLLRGVRGVGAARERLAAARALDRVPGSDLSRERDALLAALPDDARPLVASVLDALVGPSAPTLASALAHVRALAARLGWPRALERDASDLVRGGDEALLAAFANELSAWSSLVEAIDELARAAELASAGELPVTWSDVAREIESALEGRKSVAGHRAGAVPIARLRDRLGLDADVLVILEAHDGALPARGQADPLLSRGLLRALREADPRRAPPPASLPGAIDLLAAIDAIGRTRERVVVVHRGVDDDGRTQLPGALPLELARITTARPRVERAWAIPPGEHQVRRPRDRVLLLAHQARLRGAPYDPLVTTRADAERARARAFASAERGDAVATPFTGALSPLGPGAAAHLARRLGGDPASPLSVSAAEDLVACPFRVFADRVLRAGLDEPTPDDGGPRETGELAHAALLEAHRALRDAQVSAFDEAAVLAIAGHAIDRTFASRPVVSALQRVRRERLRDELLALVLADVAAMHDEGRRFVEGEIPFGQPGAEWPALALEGARGPIFVAGRIDRLDRDPERSVVTVVDYKSRAPQGLTKPAFFDERRPGSVQIALYARVAGERASPPPSRVMARFLGYRDRDVKGPVGVARGGDDTAWRVHAGDVAGGAGAGRVADAVASAAAAAIGGEVPARRGERCVRCAHRSACRVPPVVLEGEVSE